MLAPPLNDYSKLLVTASCDLEHNQGDTSSHFCPGYSDARDTPYEGGKTEKLLQMAEVFCSHCDPEEPVCNRLFCQPKVLIVNITQTMLETLCDDIKTDFPACYSEFCTSSVSRRRVRRASGQFVCKATVTWSVYNGMEEWCESACVNGYDGICTIEYCDCSTLVTTTGSPSTTVLSERGNQPGICTEWEANSIYSGTAGMDAWCQGMCSGGRCPESHCQCAASLIEISTTSADITTSTSESVSSKMTTTTSTEPRTSPSSTITADRSTSESVSSTLTSTASSDITTSTSESSTLTSTTSSEPRTSPSSTTSLDRPTSTSESSTLTSTTSTEPRTTTSTTTTDRPTSTSESVSSTLTPTESTEPRTSSTITTTTTTTTDRPTTTSSETTTLSGSTSTRSSTTSGVTQSTTLSTSVSSPANSNVTDEDSFHIVDQIVCDHAKVQGHNTISGRFCQGQVEASQARSGYSNDVIDQVLKFAPKLLCSLTSISARTDSCANMFCGESPMAQRVIRLALCNVCQSLGMYGNAPCLQAYC